MDKFYILCLNSGSLGSGEFTSNNVRLNITMLMFRIKNEFGRFPDIVCVQEAKCFIFSLAPRFGHPEAVSDHVKIGTSVDGIFHDKSRGVVTYCDPSPLVNSLKINNKSMELVVSVHLYPTGRNGKRMNKLLLINGYRNINEMARSATIEQIIEFIEQTIKNARILGIRDILVVGDFNQELMVRFQN